MKTLKGPFTDPQRSRQGKTFACLIFIALSIFAILASCAGKDSSQTAFRAELREKWGIEFVSLRLTAAGHMVDFRYRVVDPAKAAPILSKSVRAVLIDQRSGKALGVPITQKLGPLRQTSRRPRKGRVYFVFFHNANRIIKPGGLVTIKIGRLTLKDLRVSGP